MRDTLADEEYFKGYIIKENDTITEFTRKINEGIIRPERIEPIKEHLNYLKLCILIAKYSSGYTIEEIKKDYLDIIKKDFESWNMGTGYAYILRMVSLGVLLNIGKDYLFFVISSNCSFFM